MANALYDSGRNAFLNGSINFTSDTIKMILVSNLYTPNLSTDNYFNTLSSYVIGLPVALTGKTTSAGIAGCSDVNFGIIPTGQTIKYIVIYKDSGSSSTSQLIALYDTAFGLPFTTGGSEVVIRIDVGTNKLFKL